MMLAFHLSMKPTVLSSPEGIAGLQGEEFHRQDIDDAFLRMSECEGDSFQVDGQMLGNESSNLISRRE